MVSKLGQPVKCCSVISMFFLRSVGFDDVADAGTVGPVVGKADDSRFHSRDSDTLGNPELGAATAWIPADFVVGWSQWFLDQSLPSGVIAKCVLDDPILERMKAYDSQTPTE